MCKDMFDRSVRENSKEFQVQSYIDPRKEVHAGEPEQEAKFLLERIFEHANCRMVSFYTSSDGMDMDGTMTRGCLWNIYQKE
jgi:hypothetical protein